MSNLQAKDVLLKKANDANLDLTSEERRTLVLSAQLMGKINYMELEMDLNKSAGK